MGLFRRKKAEVELDEVTLKTLRYLKEPWKRSWIDPEKEPWTIELIERAVMRHIYRSVGEAESLFKMGLYLTTDRDIANGSNFAILVGQTAARLGYVTRKCEVNYRDSASEYMHFECSELESIIREVEGQPGPDRTAEAASRLAVWPTGYASQLAPWPSAGNPAEAGEISVVTKMPGIGWPARSVLADRLLAKIYMLPDAFLFFDDLPSQEELKVAWIYGFILHYIQEVAPEESGVDVPWSLGT